MRDIDRCRTGRRVVIIGVGGGRIGIHFGRIHGCGRGSIRGIPKARGKAIVGVRVAGWRRIVDIVVGIRLVVRFGQFTVVGWSR